MQTFKGIAVSPGVAIGEALVVDSEGFRIPHRFVARSRVEDELVRLDRATDAVSAEIEKNRDAVSHELGDQYGAIFSAHLQMLHDRRLRDEIEGMIRRRSYAAEYAVSRTLRRYAKVFQTLKSSYLTERANDIFDIEKSLLRTLLGHRREELSQLTAPVVVLAHNLTPSEAVRLDRRFVLGFATEIGGRGGHTAIVAEAMEIPAVVGVGRFLTDISGGERVIVDGDHGRVVFQADEKTIARYRHEVEEHHTLAVRLKSLCDLPAETIDGARIELCANIEFPDEVDACLERGADGIGLYRTEFLYLGTDSEPTEQVHYDAYAKVARAMEDRPTVVRTLDLGADKMGLLPSAEDERNPFLGVRSIRLSLRNLSLFRTQLRAILRASALGNLHIMFPLVTTVSEFRQARTVLTDVMESLDKEGAAYNRNIPVGMMVEVPAAVLMLDHFVREVDFISIGTNDLVQYTLAVDRTNKEVAELYHAADPAVLRLIEMAVNATADTPVKTGLCGQMSGSPTYTMLLLGLGMRSLSVPPSALLEIKNICRSVTTAQCEAIARRALTMENAGDIGSFLSNELRKILPEMAIHE